VATKERQQDTSLKASQDTSKEASLEAPLETSLGAFLETSLETSLEDRLFQEYYRFSFFMAVHLIERLYPEKKPLGSTLNPEEEAVRFQVEPGLSFPASEISQLYRVDDKEGRSSVSADNGQIRMGTTFMGLIGPSGVLPYWYNELALERVREKDFSLTAFLDIFHHRLISLFYLAWKRSRLAAHYQPEAGDRISRHFLSLIGLGTPKLSDRLGLPKESLIYYSGLLSRAVPSATAIESAIGYFAGTRVQVEQFIEQVIPLDSEDQTSLGAANCELGVSALCGNFVLENQTKFRVNLGPMDYAHYTRFLPGGDMLGPVFSLLRYMVGIEYEFEVRLLLKRESVPLCIIGYERPGTEAQRHRGTEQAKERPGTEAQRHRGIEQAKERPGTFDRGALLGWTTWLTTPGTVYQEDFSLTFQYQ
jgi:type VI secretion system protein ImpH